MTWIITILCTCIFVELLIRLPVETTIQNISQIGQKSIKILASKRISDNWKEKIFAAYSGKLLKQTLLLASYFIFDFFIVVGLIIIAGQFQLDVVDFLFTFEGIIFSSITATIYFFIRKSFARRSL